MGGLIQLVNLVLSLLAFSLIARWYLVPRLCEVSIVEALKPLLLLHSFRHIGLIFLASGAVQSPLPPAFAQPAAFGDLAASLLAFAALVALHRGWGGALSMVWVFNVVGTLDLANAVTRGVLHDAASAMGATFWIPSVVVPALLVSHGLIFMLLLRQRAPVLAEGAV